MTTGRLADPRGERSRELAASMIRQAMDQAGISGAEVARRTGMDRSTISKLAKGSMGMTVDTLFRIVSACGVEIVGLEVRIEKV